MPSSGASSATRAVISARSAASSCAIARPSRAFINGANSKGTGQEPKPELSYSGHLWSFRQEVWSFRTSPRRLRFPKLRSPGLERDRRVRPPGRPAIRPAHAARRGRDDAPFPPATSPGRFTHCRRPHSAGRDAPTRHAETPLNTRRRRRAPFGAAVGMTVPPRGEDDDSTDMVRDRRGVAPRRRHRPPGARRRPPGRRHRRRPAGRAAPHRQRRRRAPARAAAGRGRRLRSGHRGEGRGRALRRHRRAGARRRRLQPADRVRRARAARATSAPRCARCST